jgi:hypothetical protein
VAIPAASTFNVRTSRAKPFQAHAPLYAQLRET